MAAINEIRSGLTNFEVYYGATRQLGIATVDLPEFSYKTIELSGAGIAGDFNMPAPGHFEDMEVTIHWHSIQDNLSVLTAHKAHTLTLMGAQNIYDSATGDFRAQPVKIVVRTVPHKTPIGKFEQVSETDSETTLGIDYIKIWVDKKEIFEFDKFNFISRVNGVDYLAGTREAIGR